MRLVMRRAQFAPHLPANPQQEQAANQKQADDGEKLDRDQRETDAQHGGGDDADQNGLGALVGRQARRGEADDDSIVAGEHQIDGDHLQEGGKALGRENFHIIVPHL
jgi:hypothetical protein